MLQARAYDTATLLGNGKVLIAGGTTGDGSDLSTAELYDPATGKFTPTGSMNVARACLTATLLKDSRVLMAGGDREGAAELYDPKTGKFSLTGSMTEPRECPAAVRLNDGRVLVAGGSELSSAELYDPATGRFSATGFMGEARLSFGMVLLPDGDVFVAGDGVGSQEAPEIFEPVTGQFGSVGTGVLPGGGPSVTGLRDGRVLVAGGDWCLGNIDGPCYRGQRAEVYGPLPGLLSPTGTMATPRCDHLATLLTDGRVLVVGGQYDGELATSPTDATPRPGALVLGPLPAEIFNPGTGQFSSGPTPAQEHTHGTATLLPDGTVLLAGGGSGKLASAAAELWRP